jgi:hypothetical protein
MRHGRHYVARVPSERLLDLTAGCLRVAQYAHPQVVVEPPAVLFCSSVVAQGSLSLKGDSLSAGTPSSAIARTIATPT